MKDTCYTRQGKAVKLVYTTFGELAPGTKFFDTQEIQYLKLDAADARSIGGDPDIPSVVVLFYGYDRVVTLVTEDFNV